MATNASLTAYEAARIALARSFSGKSPRLTTPGWFHVGGTPIECPDCSGETHGFRRGYTTRSGEIYHYWALACPSCGLLFTPQELPKETRRLLYKSSGHRPLDMRDEAIAENTAHLNDDPVTHPDGASMPISEQIIDEAYHKLSKTRLDAWQAAERLAMRRMDLQRAKAERVVAGEIHGKNESEREAMARSLLREEFTAVELAELEERRTGIAVEICRIEIERIQTVIRYLGVRNVSSKATN